jgi:hypothetical protein
LAATPPKRRGEFCFCWHVLGLRIARARRAILTPGYQLSLLRSWRIVVMKQNVGVSQDVVQKENSETEKLTEAESTQIFV